MTAPAGTLNVRRRAAGLDAGLAIWRCARLSGGLLTCEPRGMLGAAADSRDCSSKGPDEKGTATDGGRGVKEQRNGAKG